MDQMVKIVTTSEKGTSSRVVSLDSDIVAMLCHWFESGHHSPTKPVKMDVGFGLESVIHVEPLANHG